MYWTSAYCIRRGNFPFLSTVYKIIFHSGLKEYVLPNECMYIYYMSFNLQEEIVLGFKLNGIKKNMYPGRHRINNK